MSSELNNIDDDDECLNPIAKHQVCESEEKLELVVTIDNSISSKQSKPPLNAAKTVFMIENSAADLFYDDLRAAFARGKKSISLAQEYKINYIRVYLYRYIWWFMVICSNFYFLVCMYHTQNIKGKEHLKSVDRITYFPRIGISVLNLAMFHFMVSYKFCYLLLSIR